MNISNVRFDRYSADAFVRVADRVASGKRRPEDSPPEDREIELGIRYFIRKYRLWARDVLNFDNAINVVERESDRFENGLVDLGFLTKFRKRVLAQSGLSMSGELVKLLETSPLTYFAWGCAREKTVTNVSPNVVRNFGYSPEAFVAEGKAFTELIYPDDFMRVQQEIHENVAVKKLPEYDLYYRVVHADGRIRFVHDHTKVTYGENGEATQSFGFVIDVTDREEARLMLDDYVRAIDQSAIVQIVDREGIIRYANDLYREVTGDEREIIGKPVRVLWGKKYHDQLFWEDLWTTVLAGKIWSGVVRNPMPNKGEESYYSYTTITPLQNAKGEYDRFIAIKFDVTRLKEAEKALRETNARFEKILNSTSQGFWSIDAQLNIREVNSGLCKLLGYETSELVGKNIRDLLDEPNRKIVDRQAGGIRRTDHRSYEIEMTRKDGTNVPVSVKATTIRTADGEFSEAVSFVNDASEARAFQKKLYLASITDELTGVGNRRYFDTEFLNSLNGARAGKIQNLSLAICDIDHFKRVNDGFGHAAGDEVLRFFGKKLSEISDVRISVYRLGGEEFGLIGIGVPLEEMRRIIEGLRIEIQDTPIAVGSQHPIKVTISAGVTCCDRASADFKNPQEIFVTTDALLYFAKNSGRNNVKAQGDM